MSRRPVIAVTLGDPAGVGPEIVADLFRAYRPARSTALLVGAFSSLEPHLGRRSPRMEVVADPREAASGRHRVCFLDTGCRKRVAVGRDSAGGGAHAGAALEAACQVAKAGVAKAIVTAPLSKHALDRAGYRFTGHTEFLARYFDAPDCQMMMVYRRFRVVPLTRHVPLRDVARMLTAERVVTGLRVVAGALEGSFGIANPHIAVAGLNPHAGESGLLGTEEGKIIRPAIRRARRSGIDAVGPLPADALFQKAQDGTFDAFVAMYHDQGLIPFKMLARRRGVNVTVGLPIVRTSVDHGVAYDLAGTGKATSVSLRAAYRLAETLVARGRI